MSDIVIDETGISRDSISRGDLIFVATKYASNLVDFSDGSSQDALRESVSVIFHNGDAIPSDDIFAILVERFRAVWSVNTTDASRRLGVRPLPIGLENAHWNTNGVAQYAPIPARRSQLMRVDSRPTHIMASFNSRTNPAVRAPLREMVAHRDDVTWLEPVLNVEQYCDQLARSVFVLSPQGNGLDCHRTWEAMYFGAIPVVTPGTLAEEFVSTLPILEATSWEWFFQLDIQERAEIAADLSKRSTEMAYMPFWCSLLKDTST